MPVLCSAWTQEYVTSIEAVEPQGRWCGRQDQRGRAAGPVGGVTTGRLGQGHSTEQPHLHGHRPAIRRLDMLAGIGAQGALQTQRPSSRG